MYVIIIETYCKYYKFIYRLIFVLCKVYFDELFGVIALAWSLPEPEEEVSDLEGNATTSDRSLSKNE